MNWLNSILILLAAFVAVFLEATFDGVRHLLGAQIDLLPALIVYASLSSNLVTDDRCWRCWAACGLTRFPPIRLGSTILPLFLAGFIIYPRRGLILREQYYAQFVLGLAPAPWRRC